ncbi:MAG TPA: PIN domain-containing protein [Thermoanaerobaculia bacterium]|nr:PIN domain-containing protein [Thermoanaerobaculia bacterium]
MPSLAIVDSGPLLASVNRADPDHAWSVDALRSSDRDLVIPALCVAEVSHLLGRRLGPRVESLFMRGLAGFDVRAPAPEDWTRIADLVDRFADLPLGGTDASVIALAERLDAGAILTLDRRHFTVARPANGAEILLPP